MGLLNIILETLQQAQQQSRDGFWIMNFKLKLQGLQIAVNEGGFKIVQFSIFA